MLNCSSSLTALCIATAEKLTIYILVYVDEGSSIDLVISGGDCKAASDWYTRHVPWLYSSNCRSIHQVQVHIGFFASYLDMSLLHFVFYLFMWSLRIPEGSVSL